MASALEEEDSVLFVATCTALTRHPQQLLPILSKLVPVSKSKSLPFTTSANLLRLLLSYVSAVAAPIEDIATIALDLSEDSSLAEQLDVLDLLADVQDLVAWITREYDVNLTEPQGAIVQTAQDLVHSLASKAEKLGFAHTENPKKTLLSFVQAKTRELSNYYSDIQTYLPLFELLKGDNQFESWYHGVVLPYLYYWQNYASLNDDQLSSDNFFSAKSYWDQFDILIAPLGQQDTSFADKLSPQRYLSQVILPFAVFHGNNLQSLTTWLFIKQSLRSTLSKFSLWAQSIETVLDFADYKGQKFPEHAYLSILKDYVAACIYFGVYSEEEITSLEQSNIYDQILGTVNLIIFKLGVEDTKSVSPTKEINFDNLSKFESFADFLNAKETPFTYLIEAPLPQSLVSLRECVSTCGELSPVSQLSMKEYFRLKSLPSLDFSVKQNAVANILTKLTDYNYPQLLKAIDLFSQTFAADEIEHQREIDQLIVERLLHVNLIPNVIEFYQNRNDELKMSNSTVFDLTIRKFWDLFENATSLDERIGKLRLAYQCMELMNTLSIEGGLSEQQRQEAVRIKHLLNALMKLKNFKFVVEKNQPVTPHQVVSKLKAQSVESTYSPIVLISSVLEQNPKAYYAFEKLYKIASDLAIFLELEVTIDYLPKVQSACIESSLVDGNFDFAYKQSKDLFDYYTGNGLGEKLNEYWLTFYQVGKFILADWLNDYDDKVEKSKISTLMKQREILSLTLKLAKPSTSTVDNSRLIISQLRHINREINVWFSDNESRRGEHVQRAAKSTHVQLQENINGLLNEAAHTAAQSKNQASQKISNLLASGLGWAIGAQRSDLQK